MERVFELFPRVKERLNQIAGTLSGGEQQMVAMGRALMARPKLLCMDEPSMGLSPLYVEQVFDHHPGDQQAGHHDLHGGAERQHGALDRRYGYVLQTGEVVLHGTAESLRHNDMVQQAYLGEMKVA